MDSPIACWRDRVVSRARFLGDIACIARQLPAARFIVNLCEDRYRFLAAFAAVGVNGQTNLLPSSRATLHLQQLAEDYPDSRSVTDQDIEEWVAAGVADNAPPSAPALPVDHLMAVAFTSGSTGRAKPNLKYWGELVSGAQQARQRFGFKAGSTVIATVPPQHMYGLETSIMAPLLSGVCVHASRPFFPEDVRAALADALPSRVLITTPVHLRACVEAQLTWPELAFVISATAPLSLHLAERAEQIFNAPVLEIYGCTEAGSIASRRTLEGEHWLLYDGFQLAGHCLSGAHLPEPTPLSDVIEVCSENRFRLLGRHEDLINLAGKRSSLAYLNHQINQIEVNLHMPKVPYKETIHQMAQAQGKYKKQTGGHGQYGDCWLQVEPLPRGGGFEFHNKIVGGVIPRNFIPAVEKGVQEALQQGCLAGFPVVDIRVTVYDGSHHPVDSSEMAFKVAASMGLKKAMEEAHPTLLEPMMEAEVSIPDEVVGTVIGDLNSRRGRIQGMAAKGHHQIVKAIVPLAEMLKYAPSLTSMTAGKGSYSLSFLGYEEVPRELLGRVAEEHKKEMVSPV